MAKPSSIRTIVVRACTGLGTLWLAAGVLKLIFGVEVTLPIFPPIDLDRVATWPAVAVGLSLVFVGAWLQRISSASTEDVLRGFAEDDVPLLREGDVADQLRIIHPDVRSG
jgi:hypothetical protein